MIETERLLLRLPIAADFDGFAELHADEGAEAGLAQSRSRQVAGPLEDLPIEIWGQTREEWFARRAATTA